MMNTPSKQKEQLSSLLDAELDSAEVVALLASIKSEQGNELEQSWSEYVQISDALHSDELNPQLSDDFSARFSARLAQEPTVIAPAQLNISSDKKHASWIAQKSKYIAGLAAISAFVFVVTNQMGPQSIAPTNSSEQVAQQMMTTDVLQVNANFEPASANDFAPKMENQVEMLRDPSLDSYLMAHQKVSPSLDNSGRYIQKAKIEKPDHSEAQK